MYFALTENERHSLSAKSVEEAIHISENILHLDNYQIQTHEEYWNSPRGIAELKKIKAEQAFVEIEIYKMKSLQKTQDPVKKEQIIQYAAMKQAIPDDLKIYYYPEIDPEWPS